MDGASRSPRELTGSWQIYRVSIDSVVMDAHPTWKFHNGAPLFSATCKGVDGKFTRLRFGFVLMGNLFVTPFGVAVSIPVVLVPMPAAAGSEVTVRIGLLPHFFFTSICDHRRLGLDWAKLLNNQAIFAKLGMLAVDRRGWQSLLRSVAMKRRPMASILSVKRTVVC